MRSQLYKLCNRSKADLFSAALMFERRMFIAGSWGADFHPDLKPLESEIVLTPHKSTDVFETDLPDHLARLGTTHLIIAGMAANLCCESTGRRATEKGFDVTFLKDAIGSEDLLSYEAAIKINYPLIGNAVLNVDDLLSAFASFGQAAVPVKAGDMVCGSDGGEIGKVAELLTVIDWRLGKPGATIYDSTPQMASMRITEAPRGHAAHLAADDIGPLAVAVTGPRRNSMRSSVASGVMPAACKGTGTKETSGAVTAVFWRFTARARHLCTRLALTPCAMATAAIDAPGRSHSARICAFRLAPWRRRRTVVEVGSVMRCQFSRLPPLTGGPLMAGILPGFNWRFRR